MAIGFYTTKDEYGEFSNFSAFGIELDGQWYPTSEHYFQAQKFEDAGYCEKIRLAKSPMIAARLGRSRKVRIRGDWEDAKIDVMRTAVRKKFATHAELAKLLLSTGEEELFEVAPGDYFWGCGKDGSGQNWLGQILMEVREELRNEIES
ncbi:Swarming motility protein YbiA [Polystyrenella longa]|uniref:Swarming motility protein YbiA n=1 Tax=Polystyrenella longa TaxID=2528007 RepID=A0A518CI79_9PLAN|nr:NADAR family protein [Polystyrenella longa]QDU78920.1 Swarming motility protein YbiA [Polystyrenella longa]